MVAERASEKLLNVVAQIDNHSWQLFEETYRKVRANFQALFRRLFGGRSTDTRLERIETVTITEADGSTREVEREVDVLEADGGGRNLARRCAIGFGAGHRVDLDNRTAAGVSPATVS
ncbi:MAG: hypothetical protein EXS29_08725 [Pedosphaera sp.]|nr:hypothetical protein [Pedosphaera sp.]